MTFLLLTLLWTVLVQSLDLLKNPKLVGATLYGELMLYPASWLRRLPEGSAAAPEFQNHFWGSAAFVTLGLALIFLVVALRNYLADPLKQ